jgi:ABC-type multidrug transport system fused ATPase/permease subunit
MKSEQLVRNTLTELSKSMSVVIIAHRLSTLEFCDRIMVVQQGALLRSTQLSLRPTASSFT